MKVESLEKLEAAFGQWRRNKKHRRDATPEELLKRARAAVRFHGQAQVLRAVKIDCRRLREAATDTKKRGVPARVVPEVPSYSRVKLVAPSVERGRPFAELEMPSGVKLRLYSGEEETLTFLASVCGTGGGR